VSLQFADTTIVNIYMQLVRWPWGLPCSHHGNCRPIRAPNAEMQLL